MTPSYAPEFQAERERGGARHDTRTAGMGERVQIPPQAGGSLGAWTEAWNFTVRLRLIHCPLCRIPCATRIWQHQAVLRRDRRCLYPG